MRSIGSALRSGDGSAAWPKKLSGWARMRPKPSLAALKMMVCSLPVGMERF
jgi:hypothetical protein